MRQREEWLERREREGKRETGRYKKREEGVKRDRERQRESSKGLSHENHLSPIHR